MSGRTVLADALRSARAWTVVADARLLDSITRHGAVVLWTTDRERAEQGRGRLLIDTLEVWYLTGTDKPDAIEDDLEAGMEAVLEVLESLPAFTWSKATRGILAERWHGWQITGVTCAHRIETPSTTD